MTPKDLLYKVVAKGRPLDSTPVAEVMTADPDVMSGSATAVQVASPNPNPILKDEDPPLTPQR